MRHGGPVTASPPAAARSLRPPPARANAEEDIHLNAVADPLQEPTAGRPEDFPRRLALDLQPLSASRGHWTLCRRNHVPATPARAVTICCGPGTVPDGRSDDSADRLRHGVPDRSELRPLRPPGQLDRTRQPLFAALVGVRLPAADRFGGDRFRPASFSATFRPVVHTHRTQVIRVPEIGVQNGPGSGGESARRMDPPLSTRESSWFFSHGRFGSGAGPPAGPLSVTSCRSIRR